MDMEKKQSLLYKNSPRWNLLLEDGQLFATKGADETFWLEDIEGEAAENLYDAYCGEAISEFIAANGQDKKLVVMVGQLEKAGIIYKKVNQDNSLVETSFAINWLGNPHSRILELLKDFAKSSERLIFVEDTKKADFLVMVRTSAQLADLIKNYANIKLPHLLMDIAYDHMLSLGPLVFPGETACLNCFVGRVAKNWGDAEPPKISNASDSAELIASLVIEQVRLFQKLGSCPELIEKVWSFNLRDLNTKSDSLFRLPWCPTCYPDTSLQEGLGSFEMPWQLKSSQV